jgi:hypothetical protein
MSHRYTLREPAPSPSATLGEGEPGKQLTGKSSSPSAKYRALGEAFPECLANSR